MARYYFERVVRTDEQSGLLTPGWDISDRHMNERIGTLHDVVLAERVVALLNDYEDRRHQGR